MATGEQLNTKILEGIYHEILTTPQENHLINFIMSGKEPFYLVMNSIEHLHVNGKARNRRQMSCRFHTGPYVPEKTFCIQQVVLRRTYSMCCADEFLLRLLWKNTKAIEFNNSIVDCTRYLPLLAENKKLKKVIFFSNLAFNTCAEVLRHLPAVDEIEGSVDVCIAVIESQLQVKTLTVESNNMKAVLKITPFSDMPALKKFNINFINSCGLGIPTFNDVLDHYERVFSHLEELEITFFAGYTNTYELVNVAGGPVSYRLMSLPLDALEDELRAYSGRLKIVFNCHLHLRGQPSDDCIDNPNMELPGYTAETSGIDNSNSVNFSKLTEISANVKMTTLILAYQAPS